MIQNIEMNTLIGAIYEGMTLVSSEFDDPYTDEEEDRVYDFNSYEQKVYLDKFNYRGKKIIKAEVGASYSERMPGLLFWFEGWNEPFFFNLYDNLILEDTRHSITPDEVGLRKGESFMHPIKGTEHVVDKVTTICSREIIESRESNNPTFTGKQCQVSFSRILFAEKRQK